MKYPILVIFLILIFVIGCQKQITEVNVKQNKHNTENNNLNIENEIKNSQGVENMKLTSPAFKNNSMMPSEYTCDGDGVSPELSIADVPNNAKSLVLISDDPDAPAGTWDHWVMFNIPPETKVIGKDSEPDGVAGKNSWGKTGYGGPCPPSGTHRYFFKLYALDTILSLKEGATKKEIEKAMQGHIIEKTEIIANYKRQ
jgi:Raf kinase inhibitor-like YbhB/YbcL family protein